MRPTHLKDFMGQNHILGPGKALRAAIESDKVHSMILWGSPGVGKTTFARLLAHNQKREFFQLSAADSGIKSVRDILETARELIHRHQPSPILFLDEIHRFTKSQQDSLLGGVEKGIIILIGATTENPSFELNRALLSRCRVYHFEEMGRKDLEKILQRAVKEDPLISKHEVELRETEELILYSGGDVRKLLNALELVVDSEDREPQTTVIVTNERVASILRQKNVPYDKSGNQHYDTISAFIKSIRGSDPDAALYYLHTMISGGEDIKFICRRMIISASEDIGLANPNALLIATSCFQAATMVGLPEAAIPMSQTAIYLACSPKSNSAYLAMHRVQKAIKDNPYSSIPLHLRNAPDKLTRELGHGKNYKYPHDFPGNFVHQTYLPKDMDSMTFFVPGESPFETRMMEIFKQFRAKHKETEDK